MVIAMLRGMQLDAGFYIYVYVDGVNGDAVGGGDGDFDAEDDAEGDADAEADSDGL